MFGTPIDEEIQFNEDKVNEKDKSIDQSSLYFLDPHPTIGSTVRGGERRRGDGPMNTKMINGFTTLLLVKCLLKGKKGGVSSRENLINRKDWAMLSWQGRSGRERSNSLQLCYGLDTFQADKHTSSVAQRKIKIIWTSFPHPPLLWRIKEDRAMRKNRKGTSSDRRP